MPADPTPARSDQPHGATAARRHRGAGRGRRSRRRPAAAPRPRCRDLPWEVGVAKPDPAIVVDGVRRTFGGLTAVVGRPPRDPARRHHRPDRPERRRQDDAVQPADRLRPAQHRHLVLRRHGRCRKLGPHQVARLGVVRTFQLTKALSRLTVLQNMLLGAQGQKGERFFAALIPGVWRARSGRTPRRPWTCSPGSSSTPRRTTSPAPCPAVSASCSRWRAR